MQKILNISEKIEYALMASLASAALLLAVFEMVMRYYFASYLADWTSEVVIYFITAAVMLSGGRLVTENRHVKADVFLRMVPPKKQRYVEIIICLIGLSVCGLLVERGLGIVEFGYRLDERSDSSLQFPLFIYYAFVPFSFFLMFMHYLFRFVRYVFAFDESTMATVDVDLDNAD